MSKSGIRSYILGAVFLMAASAIGPGFLTQTATFTETFMANFAFAILISILIDVGAQLNIWRVIGIAKKRGHEIANSALPGLGVLLTVLIIFGGLAFNIGNVAGCGLALQVLFGIDLIPGVIISACLAIAIFLVKEAGKVMDKVAQILGVLMIILTTYVAIKSSPPVGEAVKRMIVPENYGVLMLPMITIIGGTVGGYITFSGAHRLVDAGVTGKENLSNINRASITGILVTGVMRILLFLAALGVVVAGHKLGGDNPFGNPAAEVFRAATGNIGYKFFGIVLFAAGITSVIGSAYTSVSFLKGYHEVFTKYNNYFIIAFIAFSTLVFSIYGRPVTVLVVAGSLNGLILPFSLGAMLLAANMKKIMGEDYKHPVPFTVAGVIALCAVIYGAYLSLGPMFKLITG